jgi:hypothetical protein
MLDSASLVYVLMQDLAPFFLALYLLMKSAVITTDLLQGCQYITNSAPLPIASMSLRIATCC